jgi:hypothetical protein
MTWKITTASANVKWTMEKKQHTSVSRGSKYWWRGCYPLHFLYLPCMMFRNTQDSTFLNTWCFRTLHLYLSCHL